MVADIFANPATYNSGWSITQEVGNVSAPSWHCVHTHTDTLSPSLSLLCITIRFMEKPAEDLLYKQMPKGLATADQYPI